MALAKDTFQRIIEGICRGHSLRSQLESLKIHPMDFADFIHRDPIAHEQYARARELRTDFQAEDVVRIADETVDPNKARVMIDARKWLASKMNPQVYGERMDLNVNQTLDIGGALAEARTRALPQSSQVIEIEEVKQIDTTGSKPEDPPIDESIDPFS